MIIPIRRCPRDRRCSVAARPPAQLVAPTDGMSGGGVLAGSITTSGMPALRSCPTCAAVGVVSHQDHPVRVMARDRRRPARRPGVAVPDGGHRDGGGVLRAPLLHPAQDLHRPRAVQAREHQVDEPGPARFLAARCAGTDAGRGAAPPGHEWTAPHPGGRSPPWTRWAATRQPPRRSRRAWSSARAAGRYRAWARYRPAVAARCYLLDAAQRLPFDFQPETFRLIEQ